MSRIGRHGFDGACIPELGRRSRWDSFSVGVFCWVPTKDGQGVKRGNVQVRVIGSTRDADAVLRKAADVAAALDADTYSGPKTVRVPQEVRG